MIVVDSAAPKSGATINMKRYSSFNMTLRLVDADKKEITMLRFLFLAFVAVAMLCINPTRAEAGLVDGNQLNETCSTASLNALCEMYVLGVVDAHASLSKEQRLCPPRDITREQLVDTVKAYLRKHAELLHYPAHSIVRDAVDEKFSCKKPRKITK